MKQLFYFIFGLLTALFVILVILKEDGASLMPILSDQAFNWLWSSKGIPLRATIVCLWCIFGIYWLFDIGKGVSPPNIPEEPFNNNSIYKTV